MALQTANQFQLTPDLVGAGSRGLQLGGQFRQSNQQAANQKLGTQIQELSNKAAAGDPQALTQLSGIAPDVATKIQTFQATQQENRFKSVVRGGQEVQNIPTVEGKIAFLENRIAKELPSQGVTDTSDTQELLDLYKSGDIAGGNALVDQVVQSGVQSGFLKAGKVAGSEQAGFESLIENLPQEQKDEAILIKLGINPRAVSSADITIAESDVLTEQVANSKAIIGQRKKFGELTGASRSKAIDSGFERIVKIDAAVRNIDKAIGALESGAGVGAIERFLPSFKAASVELDNIQKSMALDVIGAVTFGALSQGELNLAKEVALPTGLDTPQLIEHLQNRKIAQEKLKAYFNEQIQFLDQGGTIAGFLRTKEGSADVGSLSDDELFN